MGALSTQHAVKAPAKDLTHNFNPQGIKFGALFGAEIRF